MTIFFFFFFAAYHPLLWTVGTTPGISVNAFLVFPLIVS